MIARLKKFNNISTNRPDYSIVHKMSKSVTQAWRHHL